MFPYILQAFSLFWLHGDILSRLPAFEFVLLKFEICCLVVLLFGCFVVWLFSCLVDSIRLYCADKQQNNKTTKQPRVFIVFSFVSYKAVG